MCGSSLSYSCDKRRYSDGIMRLHGYHTDIVGEVGGEDVGRGGMVIGC